jgi:hypothetical protein
MRLVPCRPLRLRVVGEVDPVLLLPGGGPQGAVRLPHHDQTLAVRDAESDVGEDVIVRVVALEQRVRLQQLAANQIGRILKIEFVI